MSARGKADVGPCIIAPLLEEANYCATVLGAHRATAVFSEREGLHEDARASRRLSERWASRLDQTINTASRILATLVARGVIDTDDRDEAMRNLRDIATTN